MERALATFITRGENSASDPKKLAALTAVLQARLLGREPDKKDINFLLRSPYGQFDPGRRCELNRILRSFQLFGHINASFSEIQVKLKQDGLDTMTLWPVITLCQVV